MILIVVLYMLFAVTFTLAKAVLFYVKPLFFIGIRMMLAGSLLLLYSLVTKTLKIYKESLLLLAYIVFFHIFLAYTAEFWALQFISSAKTALIYNFSPLITAILAFLFLNESLTKKQWIGLSVGFIGFIPWFLSTSACEEMLDTVSIIKLPEVVLLIAVISASYGWIVMSQLIKKYNYSPVMINGIGMFFGGVLAFISSLLIERPPFLIERSLYQLCTASSEHSTLIFSWSAFAHFILYMLALILIANIICYNLYGYLLRNYSTTLLSFAGFLCPLFAALFGWLFLNETISINFIMSFSIIVIGLYIFYQQELGKVKGQ